VRRPIVLLVDDMEDVRRSLADTLTSEGFIVIEAANGREAIEKSRQGRPDLVLMDLSLPVLDGAAAMRVMKSFVPTSKIPVVALTGMGISAASLGALGFDGSIRKPCTPQALLEYLATVLGDRRTMHAR
jgi:CheY-like chemotaxis protein